MTETDLSTWLVTMEAAMRIGCSTRTIERLGRAKQLEQRLRPQKGSPPVVVYNPDDVARLASERRPAPAPFVLGAVPDVARGHGNGKGGHIESTLDPSGIQRRPGDDPIRQVFALLLRAIQSPPSPPVSASVAETPWVDLPTAAAILGRSQAYVRRQITAGTLHAERDRRLVVRRKDLEGL